ncbi:MAG TPA: NAD-dependent epimerase/dehydratase family protein [Candidatus Thermoplasmatota archaeon]|nr:NAD-dependent epimerase/dehydratase family protein [Candidatus Thermoplasmatota archaeon]
MSGKEAAAGAWLAGQRHIVTGGAGFIGSHLAEALADAGAQVVVVDDLRSGGRANLAERPGLRLVEGDCADPEVLDRVLPGAHLVWHAAANPEVRTGETEPGKHLHDHVDVTFALLEAMRRHGVRELAFTSTSTVYGSANVMPTPESYGPLLPVSVYGACKLACEALISAYCGTFGFRAFLFRFANVVGPRATHGVVLDFIRKLQADPRRLEVLGDGTQAKSYVSVQDTVSGMLHAVRHAPADPPCQAYNIGSSDTIPVSRIAEIVPEVMGLRPEVRYAGGPGGAGWKGDVKHMRLSTQALEALGWKARHTSEQAVRLAAQAALRIEA